MNEYVVYFLKVMAIQGLFFGLYSLILRNSGRHALNRWYLLSTLFLAFFIPFISFSLPDQTPQVVQENPVILWLSEPSSEEYEIIQIQERKTYSWWALVPIFYGLVVFVLVLRSTFHLSILSRLKRNSEPILKKWFTLFKTSQNRSFSFFSNVFIPRWLFGTDAFDQVLAHECVHVRQLHSVDRLLLDFVVSLFWFNPFIYLYRNALIEIHEYQADEAVVKEFKDPIAYQEILYSQLQTPQYSELVSHFNFQMIKKRIVMMNKQKKRTGWVYALAAPLTLVMIFAFSSKETMNPIDEVGDEISAMIGPIDEVTGLAEMLFQSDNEPSILPFKEKTFNKMTSGFGMRMHPIDKERKFHRGMDFSCKTGTEIIATADGTVEKVRRSSTGYGNLLVVDHGNGFVTKYAQLSSFKVQEGDKVQKGQVIAFSGNSGASTAPHLHYEVVKNGEAVNPADYIKNYQFKSSAVHHHERDQEHEEEVEQQEHELARQEMFAIRQLELAERERELAVKEQEKALVAQERSSEAREKALEEQERVLEEQVRAEELHQQSLEAMRNAQVDSEKEKQKEKTKSKEKRKGKQQSFKVIIDPGHGGKDAGAISKDGIEEKEATLTLATLIFDEFENHENIEVVLTRTDDRFLSLEERVKLTEDADLLLSLHFEAHQNEEVPFSSAVYFDGSEFSEDSRRVARGITEELAKAGTVSRVGISSGFYIMREAHCPSVLVNIGYALSHDIPQRQYEEGQSTASRYLANAIEKSLM